MGVSEISDSWEECRASCARHYSTTVSDSTTRRAYHWSEIIAEASHFHSKVRLKTLVDTTANGNLERKIFNGSI
jgi:hypothetical protein